MRKRPRAPTGRNRTQATAKRTTTTVQYDDLDGLAGSWDDDPAVAQALADQDRVDEALWVDGRVRPVDA